MRSKAVSVFVVALLLVWAGAVMRAHEITYQGTVLAVESARLQVKTIDEKTKKEDSVWFVVNKDTKLKRGEKTMPYADAKIVKGERIAVTVDHDAKIKMLSTEILLAVAK